MARTNRSEFNAHADIEAGARTHYTGEHVAAMMRAREAHALRQRNARRAERFYMLATIAGLVAVIAYMFHHLTK